MPAVDLVQRIVGIQYDGTNAQEVREFLEEFMPFNWTPQQISIDEVIEENGILTFTWVGTEAGMIMPFSVEVDGWFIWNRAYGWQGAFTNANKELQYAEL